LQNGNFGIMLIFSKKMLVACVIVLLTCIVSSSEAQSMSGQIVDENNGEPLVYAHIFIPNQGRGTVAFSDGRFKLDISGIREGDSIRFSYIGYITKSFQVGWLKDILNPVIRLIPNVLHLNAVVVTAKPVVKKLGFNSVGRLMTGWGDVQSMRGRIRGVLIEGAKCPTKVNAMFFRINHNEWDSVAFRVNFMSFDNRQIGPSILKRNIFVTTNLVHKWVRVPLIYEDIIVCEKVIVTLEWVDAWGKTGEFSNLLTISYSKSKGMTFSKEPSQETGSFEFNENVPAIYLELNDEK